MKKLLIFLALALICLCSGCKEQTGQEIPTIKWIIPGDAQSDLPAVVEAANEILAEKLGCRLDLQIIDSSAYSEKLNLAMAGGENFDICYLNSSMFSSAVQMGGLLDLDDFVSHGKITKSVSPDILKYGSYNGSVYAIPNVQIMSHAHSLFVRKDLAEEYGLDISSIHSINDIEPFLKWIKETHPEYYPIRITSWLPRLVKGWENTFYDELVSHVVFAVENEDGTVKVVKAIDCEPFWALAELKNDWYKKGYIREDVAVASGNDWDDVNRGKYAVYTETYKPGGVEGVNRDSSVSPRIEVLFTELYKSYDAGAATMTAINKKSRYPELAYEIIELANTDKEFYNILSFGIEGRNYTKNSDGRITINQKSGYSANAGWRFGNQFNAYILSSQPKDIWERTKKLNDEARSSKLTGYKPDFDKIKIEISQITTVQKRYNAIQTGSGELSAYKADYIKELNDAGLDTVVAELQRQVDEWLLKTVE